MAVAHQPNTGLWRSVVSAIVAAILGLVLVIAIPPVAAILAVMLVLYDAVEWRRRSPLLVRLLTATSAFCIPVALYFILAAVR